MKIKELAKRENIISLVLSLGITIIFAVDSNFFNHHLWNIAWVIIPIIFAASLMTIMIRAGFTIMKSLALVAAELSLLIFLSQSYCALPKHSAAGDDALKNLLIIGFLYITFIFFRSLYGALITDFEKIDDKKKLWQKILFIVLFLMFICWFAWEIYMVISPIVHGLCIYK